MLTEEKAKEYTIVSSYGLPLENQAFRSENLLWKKKGTFIDEKQKQPPLKRFEFLKIGRTLGLETRRYLSVEGTILFYYDVRHILTCRKLIAIKY